METFIDSSFDFVCDTLNAVEGGTGSLKTRANKNTIKRQQKYKVTIVNIVDGVCHFK